MDATASFLVISVLESEINVVVSIVSPTVFLDAINLEDIVTIDLLLPTT